MDSERCYACNRPLRTAYVVMTEDGQPQYVGADCFKQVTVQGYQPPLGGPRLYPAVSP